MPNAQQPSALSLKFDNQGLRALPADPVLVNQRRRVNAACYSRVEPTKVSAPYLVAWSSEVAALLGLSASEVTSQAFLDVFSGNAVMDGMDPSAACYGGHQFGNWAGQLGDGRAISLGEAVAPSGEYLELQLKGAGPTPYSRTADGRAVMRSSVREFLCSEAMHHLGVPTTRALCLVGTGDLVKRDMFYDGNAKLEPGAIVCRVAPTFLRFGNFQLPAERDELDVLQTLVDYTITRYFPRAVDEADPRAAFFGEVCESSALLAAEWQRVGFVHGVLNTDNMSILGLTLDYGPYGWLEDYNPDWTPNTTDAAGGRYRFGRQPQIVGWNLARLGEALLALGTDRDALLSGLAHYQATFERLHAANQVRKLGLNLAVSRGLSAIEPEALATDLHRVLQLTETDMTLFYRNLSDVAARAEALQTAPDSELLAPLLDAYYQPTEIAGQVQASIIAWLRQYTQRVLDEAVPVELRRSTMHAVNPRYVLRNYLAQLAIDAAEQGDCAPVAELLSVLRAPYTEQPGQEAYAAKRPEWARTRPGCSALSCSS